MAVLMPEGKQSFTDSKGAPLVGGKLFTYDAGTSTPRPTYQDAAGTAPNTNPVVLDARGEASVFFSAPGAYKVVLRDSAGVLIWSQDNIVVVATADAALIDYVPADPGAVSTTVQYALRNADVPTIAALRSVSKGKKSYVHVAGYYARGDGGGGMYAYDSIDTTSVDNGGTVIVGADGGRWKLLHTGTVSILQFGFVGDWNGSAGTNNLPKLAAMIADTRISRITGVLGAFWFGNIAGDTTALSVTRLVDLDWCGASLFVSGNNSSGWTGTVFLEFLDCRTSVRNYTFTDTGYNSVSGPSRGVIPVSIRAATKTTYGHTIGPCHVEAGQSLVTVSSSNPNTFRSKSIALVGACTGNQVYYGVNAANNGDDISGEFTVQSALRVVFVYGVDGVRLRCRVVTGRPSSANILISSSGVGFPATRNVDLEVLIGELNGPLVLADQPVSDGTGVYENIRLKARIDSLGSNINAGIPLVRIAAYDNVGGYITAERTMVTENMEFDIEYGSGVPNLDIPVQVYTPSKNHGKLKLNQCSQYSGAALSPKNPAGEFLGPVIETNGLIHRTIHGNLSAPSAVVRIPTKYLTSVRKNTSIGAVLRITARESVGFGSSFTVAEYFITGFLSSAGALGSMVATLVSSVSTVMTPTITIAVGPGGLSLDAAITLYATGSSAMTASISVV